MSGRKIMKVNNLEGRNNSQLTKFNQTSNLPVPINKAPEYTVQILKECGLSPKVFCYADPVSDSANFEVVANSFDWAVEPVTSKNIAQIPTCFIETVRHLLANRFPISELALAKPKLVEAPEQVLRQELQKEITAALNICQFCVSLLLNVTKMLSEGVSSSSGSSNDLPLEKRTPNGWDLCDCLQQV